MPSSERHCLIRKGAGHCGAIHADWFVLALCLLEMKPVHVEDLVLRSATGESVPVYVPNRGGGRASRHMWVSAGHRAVWEELVREKLSLPAAPTQEDDDRIIFAEQEFDRACRAGQGGWFADDARPVRKLCQPTGGFTLPWLPVQRPQDPLRITDVERVAASMGSRGSAPGAVTEGVAAGRAARSPALGAAREGSGRSPRSSSP